MPLKRIRNIIILISLIFLSFGFGYQLGYDNRVSLDRFVLNTNLLKKQTDSFYKPDIDLFWDVWGKLQANFIHKEKLNNEKMLYGAISGLVSSLDDPYTVFLNPTQNNESKEELEGSFEGIGAQLGLEDKKIVVIAPLSGTPAEKEGLRSGDWILRIDGQSTEKLSLPQAVAKIRGPKGTLVELTVISDKETKSKKINIERNTILVKSVETSEDLPEKFKKVKLNNAYYLKLSRFGDETMKEWDEIINKLILEKQRSRLFKGLILDLRNNPGGYLTGAIEIASEFLPRDSTVVIQENTGGRKQNYLVKRQGKLLDIPMIVLVNKGSASASEIVAGALKHYKRAKIVGEKTFGKGSIQEALDLSKGAGLHVTTAKWLLPDGTWINGSGIKPDVMVESDKKNPENDIQLKKAIELLN